VSGRPKVDLPVLLGYAAVSFAYFGWRLVPHPGRLVLSGDHDAEVFLWSFARWPHALGSWTDPFVSHAVDAPGGINLAWSASSPGLALLVSPLTVVAGPVVSYNTAAVLLPAVAAWTAYLLCRELTGSTYAAVVGGYLFGFSTAVLRQQVAGHLHQTAVFLLPLIALVVIRFVRGRSTGRGLAWQLGVLVGLRLWISTEVALTATLVLALCLALAAVSLRDLRPRLRASLAPLAAGYALAAVVAAPLLVFALSRFVSRSIVDLPVVGTDLLAFVVPTEVTGLGGTWLTSVGHAFLPGGKSAYVGLPTLLVVAAYALRVRRDPGARVLLTAFAVCAVVALGASLDVDGRRLIGLPWWRAAVHVPALDQVLAFRFATYVSLAAGVIVAVWTASTRGLVFARPYVLPALAVAALVPAVWREAYPSFRPARPPRTAFFTAGLYRSCRRPGDTVAVFPFGAAGYSLLWQAEAGFRFRLAGDGLQPIPRTGPPLSSFDADPFVADLTHIALGRPTAARLLAFAARHRVDRILVADGSDYPTRAQLRAAGPVGNVGGMRVAPACGTPSLARRDLTRYVRQAAADERPSRPSIGWCVGPNYVELPVGLDPAGPIAGAVHARFVLGTGLTCAAPPAGYVRRGFAGVDLGVPAGTYPLFVPRG
jgi:hypothetical protein